MSIHYVSRSSSKIKGKNKRKNAYTHMWRRKKERNHLLTRYLYIFEISLFSFEKDFVSKDQKAKRGKRTFLSIILHMIVNVISYFRDKRFSLSSWWKGKWKVIKWTKSKMSDAIKIKDVHYAIWKYRNFIFEIISAFFEW